MRKFDKYAQEGNEFLHELATELGHPEELDKTMIILKATLHTLRDRITIAESFDLMSQLPLVLKGIYVDHWKYSDRPEDFDTFDQFKDKIKKEQKLHGETEFNWSEPTEKIVNTVIRTLTNKYLSEGQLNHVLNNMPKDIAQNLKEAVTH
jgi:uncharacterized protein (DUF2267 family)